MLRIETLNPSSICSRAKCLWPSMSLMSQIHVELATEVDAVSVGTGAFAEWPMEQLLVLCPARQLLFHCQRLWSSAAVSGGS